jgi:methionyl-tRNA formyltransferase
MRVAFFGSGAFGLPTLERLSREHSVRLVVSQPDRPAGRGGKITPTPIAAWATEHLADVPLRKPESVSDPTVVNEIRSIAGPEVVDAWVVIAFGQKLPPALLEGVSAMNLHASLLPRWRGAAPINAAVLAGDAETGNSVITLAQRMDAGVVLATSRRLITPEITAGELHDLLASDGPALVMEVLAGLERERLRRPELNISDLRLSGSFVQDDRHATKAPKLSKADDWLDLGASAEGCRRRVHGLTPWPGVSGVLAGVTLKLLRVEALRRDSEEAAGRLYDPAGGLVACGSDTLRLVEVQPAGGKAMAWGEFSRGRAGVLGTPGVTLDVTGPPTGR